MAEVEGSNAVLSDAAGAKEEPPVVAGVVAGATAKAEPMESEQEDEEDVFEVESILDSKIEGSEVLYRVRWKGYDSDGDTWEPEAHLDDCKEVLLEFRRKQAENQKPVKNEMPKLSPSDLFEADSGDEQSVQKADSPPKKKKKSREEEDEDLTPEEMKKKKSKSGKCKEKSKAEAELSDGSSPDLKPKKRVSESKEDLGYKKQKKDDLKDLKKTKKDDVKDPKVKGKDELKDKKQKKDKVKECDPPAYAVQASEDLSDSVSVSSVVLTEEKKQPAEEQEEKEQEPIQDLPEDTPSELHIMEEEDDDEDEEMKVKKKKKKKHKKLKTERGEETKALSYELQMDKKSTQKKQKSLEKLKELSILERFAPLPAPVQKGSRASVEDKGRKSVDSVPEEKEVKKTDAGKEKTRKKQDLEKESRKEQKVVKAVKESKNIFDAFTVTPEDRNECTESSRIKEEMPIIDYRPVEECKTKELKQVFKERQNSRDESEPWAFAASERDQEVADPLSLMHDNTAPLVSKAQVSLAMDLQLEWMTLEDFQKHLDGTDLILPSEAISSSALKDAVKNGDYVTVKYALNSKEEYDLEQEDSSGMTLVMLAAAAGQDDVLRLLIKKGAKINSKQKNGTTALIHAAEKNYLTTVALLLEAGAYVNVQQASGETALMKACKRGNSDMVRLLLEYGVDCNVLSKHQGNALQFAKQSNNVILYEMIKNHLETLSRVVEDAIKDYFDTRLSLLEPIFPLACHRLCEGPDFSLDFSYKPPFTSPEGSGILLFVFHANYFGKEVVVRLCGPCSVQAVVLNDKFQLPVFLDAHFIYSFSPVAGLNKLFIRLTEVPAAKVKLLICAYRVQLP
ncbi:M-phase phosphoprotein 8 [Xenopus laevis]|uniref:Chromo domain-containing protein n=2 Tax=Xenopus laevis TaxID=8355 RepID=A0A974DSL9_XENLA|nr:M-phase phosphoprotein 8 [Xenopus laevis]OCT96117.1 hypothetical protein XELAEV_18013800mg [Xenopus laevis]